MVLFGTKPTHIALFDYEATKVDEIDLKKGELLKVLQPINNDWVLAQNVTSNQKGNVPHNYVAKIGSLDAEDYYFKDTSRIEAIEMLQSPTNYKLGNFLVRTPEISRVHEYSLSFVKEDKTRKIAVKHIKIQKKDNNRYYINKEICFNSVQKLIKHYQEKNLLTNTCEKPKPPVFQEWEIDRDEIGIGKTLGSGNFGEVLSGTWRKKQVALKILKPQRDRVAPQEFMEEFTIMKNIRHKHLVALYGVCTEKEPFMMVQEYVCNGNLLDCLKKSPRIYNFDDMIFISAQIASGMAYLERKLLIHRDLAARNVLMDDKKGAKICDFGLAKFCSEATTLKVEKYPVRWTSPEAMSASNHYTIKSDVWSFGILLYEIYTYGVMPYTGLNNKQVRDKVLKEGYRLPMIQSKEFKFPDNIYQVMLKCWDANPDNRPTFEQLRFFFDEYSSSRELTYGEVPIERSQRRTCSIL